VKLLGLTTNRIHDARGHVTGLIASFTDLTEMARMRQELQQQDRMAAIGEQLAGLAHEIRNPVTSIRSAMDELRRNTASTAMVERLAAIGIRESDHLNEIVTGFLDFARDPSKRRELFSLQDLLAEVEEMLRQKYADAKALEIRRSPMGDAPGQILGDRLQIRQVFLNIAQNAIEAMQENGALTMTLHPGPAGDGPGRRRGYLEVRFDDEGPGIAPDKVARIFEPFYTEKEHGVGMGLAICMRMVTAHDGTIQVASRPGGGTSMIVRLPAAA